MTWDEQLIEQWGAAMGVEQVLKGTNVMLGPAVNLARVPWAGRTFEYMGMLTASHAATGIVFALHGSSNDALQAKTPSWPHAWSRGKCSAFRAITSPPASSTGFLTVRNMTGAEFQRWWDSDLLESSTLCPLLLPLMLGSALQVCQGVMRAM